MLAERCLGRITIFALTDCPHCLRTKAAFRERQIPYTEINLSTHPDRRTDMLQLSDRLTVPQVFFNDRHVGGADEVLELIADWDVERYQREIASQPDPTDSRLEAPTTPPAAEQPPPPRPDERSVTLPGGKKATVLETVEQLKGVLPSSNLKHMLTLYKKSFTGQQAVEALRKHYQFPESDAVEFGRQLQKAQILHHVVDEHEFSGASNLYFRLHCHHQPAVLNSYRVWTERVDPDALALVKRLKGMLGKVESAVTVSGSVDYAAAHTVVPDYPAFEEAVCELQNVDMSAMEDTTRVAFAINVYNLMIKYAFMKVGIGTTNLSRYAFFGSVKMNLGGQLFSFNELENGVIRSNRKPPYSLSVPFGKSDPRLPLAVASADCRIHFALNCGARSCPPVKFFSAAALEEELRIVAMAFCEQDDNVRVDVENRTLRLSSIFNWYRVDFADTNAGLPARVVTFLRGDKQKVLQNLVDDGGKISVAFNEYDWSTNASNFVPFDKAVLKANQRSVLKALF